MRAIIHRIPSCALSFHSRPVNLLGSISKVIEYKYNRSTTRCLRGVPIYYRVVNTNRVSNYFHLPSDNSKWLGYVTVVYVQSYRRRALSVNAKILFYIIWSGIYLK